jgi:2-polyprenyl-6-hydroxyphenyl methylase/3-demethylubiquinone-9 3-methyltransferase
MKTVKKNEIKKFSALAEEWWNTEGKFKPLHKFNPVRIEYIREKVISYFKLKDTLNHPLKNLEVLDIGCGGGLLSEPIARLGANVTGIDASEANIKICKLHAKKSKLNIKYINCSPEKLKIKNKFDIILNMEVVEHVNNLDLFINSCSNLLRKDGLMFVATINKSLKSYLFAIIGAEYILRWLPIGTHDWNSFISPEELEKISIKYNILPKEFSGVSYNPLNQKWDRSKDTSVNYISIFRKN